MITRFENIEIRYSRVKSPGQDYDDSLAPYRLVMESAKIPSFEGDWLFMTEGRIARIVRHPLSPFKRRALFSMVILAIVIAIGTIGMMFLERWDPVTSFYFVALLATAEGPALSPVTVAGKLFASLMAFVSIGAAISAITFTFGPLFGYVLREGFAYVEKEEDKLRTRIVHEEQAHSSVDKED